MDIQPNGVTQEQRSRLNDLSTIADWLFISLLAGMSLIALRCLVIFVANGVFHKKWDITGQVFVSLLWGLAWFAGGFLFGFLFGIPKVLQSPPKVMVVPDSKTNGANSSQVSAVPANPKDSTPYQLSVNTNLEEISDWLTKILVGATLTQLVKIPALVGEAATYMAGGMGADSSYKAYAAAVLLFFSTVGFFSGYVLTRIFFSRAFSQSDQDVMRARLSDSDSNQLLTARISVGGDEPPDRKAQESAQKSRLVPITSSLSGSEARVLAKGAILSGDFNRAVQSSSIALAKDPTDPRSHLDYAIALYKSHAEPTLVYEALKKAHDLITPDLDASVQADIYNSLIYVALYQAPPGGFTKAIEYSEEALRKNLPVGAAFWINTACAYGQQYEYQKTSGADTELLLKARRSVVAAVKKALALDAQSEARLRQLSLAKNDDGTENWDDDLQVLAKDDEELRSLLHLQ